ncbi:hypothetical protein EDD18DRAFT_1346783 [Armillaria luteobubalina]|uniref:HNH nuclease domain-containing protein n=1 Tax=Armillaria luteobubalina TaxID=153913 RepID=A0AA39QIC7_9AGAR|nr:hypothetical protein EDD18DRAFT_1346783 [Armillaria luteobubalina]
MSEPLPDAPPDDFRQGSPEYTAYQSCRTLEALGSSWGVVVGGLTREDSQTAMFRFSPQVVARVLGYALVHSHTVQGKANVAEEILGCNQNGEFLAGLSYIYVMGMIRVCMSSHPKGSVPTSLSSHSSRASFQATADNIAAALAQPTISSSVAKDLALARDNYRCIVSGAVNFPSFRKDPMRFPEASRVNVAYTSLGHIFGQLTMDHTTGMTSAARAKLAWATSAAAVIEWFSGISVVNELNGNDIHRPENTFTIADGLHTAFDQLAFSLRPIGSDDNNTYEIHTYPSGLNASFRLPDRVMLTNATNGNIPLPDRRYFQLHDACARIAHLSGAGEVVEQLFRDMEDVKVLAEDGGSNHLLSLALSSHVQAQSQCD